MTRMISFYEDPLTSKDSVIFSLLIPSTKSSTTAKDSASFKRKVSDKSEALSNSFVVVVVVVIVVVEVVVVAIVVVEVLVVSAIVVVVEVVEVVVLGVVVT